MSADKFAYEPLFGVCLLVDVPHTTNALFAIPLIFDIAIIILTGFKTSRLAAALRQQTGVEIVRTFSSNVYTSNFRPG